MAEVKPSCSILGKTLTQDVHNEYGLLLLPAGAVLRQSEIRLLEAHHIQTVHITADTDSPEMPPPVLHWNETEAAHQYVQAAKQTENLFKQLAAGSTLSLHQFQDVFYPMLDQLLQHWGFLRFIYLKEGTENYTYRHSLNVGIVAALIGKLMGKSQDEIIFLGQAGLLHDVGKMKVPDELLSKPERLTDDEYAIMKKHTEYGAKLLRSMKHTDEAIVMCALLHHERLDGSGYPEGRTKDTIPLACQIISVADVFDAICTDRVYRRGTSPFEACHVLWEQACSGKLNPLIVSLFIHYIVLLYVGSPAILNSGEQVEVIMIHTDEPMRPLVRKGEEYLDLRQHRSLHIRKMIG